MLDFRLKAYARLKLLKEPNWQKPKYPKIDYQDLYYYSAPKSMKEKPKSLDDLDPKLLETYKKLGIPLQEQARLNGIAVDAVFDSVSVATTFKGELTKHGIIFCSMSEAIQKHPELVKKYLGAVIPITDHFFATLNSAVFTDGSFVYIPEGVRCPMELSTYFRINASQTGQFERTLIIADKGSYVSYLEGCTAPMRDENQLHAANVDINSKAENSSNYTQCDSLLMGNKCGAHTVPYIKNKNFDSNIAHEATTSKISEEQLHYCQQRGLNPEEAVGLIVNGFCKEVLQQLPMEFAVEAQKLVGISLEGSVG